MKIRIVFAAIALFAVASAFTSAKALAHKYQWKSSPNSTYYEVFSSDIVSQQEGTDYTCDATSTICTVSSDAQASLQTVNGQQLLVVPQNNAQIENGAFTPRN